ncbi:MAG: CocE/NonD family hydrolase [Microbacterium sp.]
MADNQVKLGRWARAEYRRLKETAEMPPATHTDIHVERDIPVENGARTAIGHDVAFVSEWLAGTAGDEWWLRHRFAGDAHPGRTVTLLAGWQDLFLTGTFDDFDALRARGDDVRIIAGDWTHHNVSSAISVGELMRGFDDDASAPLARIEVTGTGGGWRDLDVWPPASTPRTWHPAAAGALAETPTRGEANYTYDPVDPTPMAGGRSLNPFVAGRRSQRRRESRDDVLVFTTEALSEPVEAIGIAQTRADLTSTNPRVDLFLRLCDVDEKGASTTIVDVFRRLDAQHGRRTETLTFPPMAHRFAAGHRLRLQVSSGAHPLHLRNPGTADPCHDFSHLVASEQTIHLGEGTRLTLPVTQEVS